MSELLSNREIEQAGDYVMDLLPIEEKMAFEQKMARKPSLQAEVALQSQLLFVIEGVEDQRLKKMLQDEQTQINQEKTISSTSPPLHSSTWNNRRWWIILIAILALLLAYLFLQTQQTANPEKIYATYFQPYDNVIVSTVRQGKSSTVPSEVTEAFQNYEAGNYSAALAAFNQINNEQQTSNYQFYKALTLMELDNAIAAIPILKSVIQDTDTPFQEHAQWYLALAYLQEENIEQTTTTLEVLLDSNPVIFKDKALKLLQDLDENSINK